MNRFRAYTRKMRAKHIKRKKRITSHYWSSRNDYPYFPFDGMFSKGKIHCSCKLCSYKAYLGKHPLTRSEVNSIVKMHEELSELVD